MIKKLFTGDLNALVITNPKFNGSEAHLLRCQITRITHNVTLQPEGVQKIVEETNEQEVETNDSEE